MTNGSNTSRNVVLSGVVAALCAVTMMALPGEAMATSYSCGGGHLYGDGTDLGARSQSNPYTTSQGISLWCSDDDQTHGTFTGSNN
jgi:hypothetical protein